MQHVGPSYLLVLTAVLLTGCNVDANPTPQQLHAYALFTSVGLSNTEIIERYGPPHDIPVSLVNKHDQKIEYWTYTFHDSLSWDPTHRQHVFLKMVDDVRAIGGGMHHEDFWTRLLRTNPSWPLDWDSLRHRAYENKTLGPHDSTFHTLVRRWRERPPYPRF